LSYDNVTLIINVLRTSSCRIALLLIAHMQRDSIFDVQMRCQSGTVSKYTTTRAQEV